MRLSVLFLLVLAVAAIVTSMAAWGITYGTAYSRVSAMAAQFAALAQDGIAGFGAFVGDLLGDNARLVDSILAAQEQSGVTRTEQTKAQVTRTVGVLVNYSTNTTDQTQQQMDDVLDTFGVLINAVVADFKGLASSYVTQVRTDLAAKGSAAIAANEAASAAAKRRLQQLLDVGALDFSRAPTDPVGEADCTLLGVLCDIANEFYYVPFSVTSATGRYYVCGTFDGAVVTTVSAANGFYNETRRAWFPYISSYPAFLRRTIKQRCLTEKPIVTATGTNCPLPQGCRCGSDPRCAAYYTQFANATTASYVSGMYQDSAGPQLHNSMPLLNASTIPPSLLGVVDSSWTLSQASLLLPAPPLVFQQSYMAMLLNDTALTALGTRSFSTDCTVNGTAPGDPALPPYSALRACDPRLRTLARWVAANRSLTQPATLDFAGVLWDVSPVRTVATSYFFIAGFNKSEVNSRIEASETSAARQLNDTRAELSRKVAASGSATRAYVAALGAQNILETQAMQNASLADLWALGEAARTTLADSQGRSAANAQRMNAAQTTAVEAQKNSTLDVMGVTAGWTVAVVLTLLLAVLGLGAWGTIRVTRNLVHIIRLMEDVAHLRVENLAVPQGAAVEEVARIQAAFQVMVLRLAEYKSYIPAGAFERLSDGKYGGWAAEPAEVPDGGSRSSSGTARRSPASDRGGRPTGGPGQPPDGLPGSLAPNHPRPLGGRPAAGTPPAGVSRRSATRSVAVLAVNVVGFTDLFATGNEALCKALFSDYVTQIHAAVSLGRGNVDFLVGDQVFVTFNAHIPCADPSEAAAAVSLDLRQHLLHTLGDRLKFCISLAFGPVFATTVGYTKFKFMAAVGSPLKVAAVLCHTDRLSNGAVLADGSLFERMKYVYTFRPLEQLYMPWLKSFSSGTLAHQRVFLLVGKKALQEEEWLYQVGDRDETSDWDRAFEQLLTAASPDELDGVLGQYLQQHPQDEVALRLKERLGLWVPGCGIRV